MKRNYTGIFQDWEIAVATKLIREFQEKWTCLKREALDDMLQECLIHWFLVKDKYDPTMQASQKTFMARAIRGKLKDLVKERERQKRKGFYHSVSLYEPLGNDKNAPTLIEKIAESENYSSNLFPQADLKIDLLEAFRKLTDQQKMICRLLGEQGLTPTEASRHLNMKRSTVYDELKRIRKIFLQEGLDEYLK